MICPNCDGQGYRTERYDPSPRGVGLRAGHMEDYIECDDCKGYGLTDDTACPCCGGKCSIRNDGLSMDDKWVIDCEDCGLRTGQYRNPHEADKAWIRFDERK